MANKQNFQRLKRSSDFQKTFREGRRSYPNQWLVVNHRLNQQSESRFGWTIPGFVGTAVVRNRLKRWVREFLSANELDMSARDVNLVFKRKPREFYKTLQRKEMEDGLTKAFKKPSR